MAVLFLPRIAATEQLVGTISKVGGVATLTRGGNNLPVVLAMPVAVGDRIGTSADSRVAITFNDDSTLELGESSSFTVDHYELKGPSRVNARILLWGGHLRSAVTMIAAASPFEVHTPNAVAAVRGTEFEIVFIEGRPCPEDRSCLRYTTVGVSKGVVIVSNPTNPAPPTEVDAGYETTVACGSAATSPAPLGMGEMGAPGYQ